MMQLLVLGSLISVAVVKQPSSAQPAKTMKILALRSFICAAVILSRTRKGKEVADGIAEEVKERGRKFMDLFSVREKVSCSSSSASTSLDFSFSSKSCIHV